MSFTAGNQEWKKRKMNRGGRPRTIPRCPLCGNIIREKEEHHKNRTGTALKLAEKGL